MAKTVMVDSSKMDELLGLVQSIRTDIAAWDVEIKALKIQTKENKESIKGNGKVGLDTRTTLLEDGMKRINWVGGFLSLLLLGDIITRLLSLTH